MNRRESLKALTLGSLAAGILIEACEQIDKKNPNAATGVNAPPGSADQESLGRQAWEIERDKELNSATFFTESEMNCIKILADIIIPKDEKSGSASDAKVPEFIEFIAKDMPEHQLPLRGGIRWLNLRAFHTMGKAFADLNAEQCIKLVDEIAWPERAGAEVAQGVAFFNRLRDLVATGFFTSKIGLEDLGYVGNVPNQWQGVPPDIIKHYGLEGV